MSSPQGEEQTFGAATTADSPVEAAAAPSTAQLAQQIQANHRIKLGTQHPSGVHDNATPDKQIAATAQGHAASRSSYGNAPGGTVALDRRMLSGMLRLAETFTFHVTEIAGGSHSPNSRHYAGIGFDVAVINGVPVNASNPHWRAFVQKGRAFGATETLGPGAAGHSTHVHLAWPRQAGPTGALLLAEADAAEAAALEDAEPVGCEGQDDATYSDPIIEALLAVMERLEGERARLSVLGRELLPHERARLEAVNEAAGHVREALQALGADENH